MSNENIAPATTSRYWLPTRPYTLVDAVNRMAAATGSVRYAQLAADADYNGNNVTVYFNSYRKYHLCEYHWGQRMVLSRGTLTDALRAGAREYARGHRGANVVTLTLDTEHAAIAQSLGYVPYSEEIAAAHEATFRDARYDEVNSAIRLETLIGYPAVTFLINSADVVEYKQKCDAWIKEHRRR